VAGLTAVATDLTAYHFLLPVIGPSCGKAVSFIAATCVSYLLNKYWTFKANQLCLREASRFGTLYGSSLVINVVVNKIAILSYPYLPPPINEHVYGLAWLSATGFSTVYNYVGQRFWVFKSRPANLPELTEGTNLTGKSELSGQIGTDRSALIDRH
jgi:putative flippase GtrA